MTPKANSKTSPEERTVTVFDNWIVLDSRVESNRPLLVQAIVLHDVACQGKLYIELDLATGTTKAI